MDIRKLTPYMLQGLVVGVVAGFLFLMFAKSDAPDDNAPLALNEAKERPAGDGAGVGPVSYADAVDAATPSVVNIYTSKIVRSQPHPFLNDPLLRRFFGDNPALGPQEKLENSLGSGVIVSAQGFILTNNHVIANADEVAVGLRDGRNFPARIVGTDPDTDIAVLQIKADDLNAITIGQSEKLRVGDVVLAIGNPFGVGQTVTHGIVSATGRSQLGISTFENFIQTDAAINPGNSGGALVDGYGHLVGINTAIFSRSGGSQGIGFAIPASLAKVVMQQIVDHGRPIRGWLGVEVQDISPELAESLELAEQNGVVIAGVLRDGPAARAGLKPGDVVTHVNEQAVSSASNLINIITNIEPSKEVAIQYLREGKERSASAVVGERPAPEAQ